MVVWPVRNPSGRTERSRTADSYSEAEEYCSITTLYIVGTGLSRSEETARPLGGRAGLIGSGWIGWFRRFDRGGRRRTIGEYCARHHYPA